jgi:hypothetical protein
MSKWIVSFAFLLTSIVSASPGMAVDHIANLEGGISMNGHNGYFVLTDGTFWKVYGYVTRYRTPFEWWNGASLDVPEQFNCAPKDWYAGSEIECYPRSGVNFVDDSNASNQDELKQCTHVLINSKTGQVLFGIKMSPLTCLNLIYAEGENHGYNKGYSVGYNTGYNNGYSAGRNSK